MERNGVIGDLALSIAASAVMALMVFLGGVATDSMPDIGTTIGNGPIYPSGSVSCGERGIDETVCANAGTWATTAGGTVE